MKMTAALYVDEKRSLTLTLSKGRGDSGIAECSQLSHTEPLGRWPKGKAMHALLRSRGGLRVRAITKIPSRFLFSELYSRDWETHSSRHQIQLRHLTRSNDELLCHVYPLHLSNQLLDI